MQNLPKSHGLCFGLYPQSPVIDQNETAICLLLIILTMGSLCLFFEIQVFIWDPPLFSRLKGSFHVHFALILGIKKNNPSINLFVQFFIFPIHGPLPHHGVNTLNVQVFFQVDHQRHKFYHVFLVFLPDDPMPPECVRALFFSKCFLSLR